MKPLIRLLRGQPGLGILLYVPLTLAILGGSWLARERMIAQRMRQATHQVQLALEAHAVRTEGAYPTSLDDPAFASGFTMPTNPYGGGRMRVIQPGQPGRPGDLVYVPCGPVIVVGGGKVQPFSWNSPAVAASGLILPTEVDSYALYVYGRPGLWLHGHQDEPQRLRDEQKHLPADTFTRVDPALPRDWQNVVLIALAGEDLQR